MSDEQEKPEPTLIEFWAEEIAAAVWDRPSIETREEFRAALEAVLTVATRDVENMAPAHEELVAALEEAEFCLKVHSDARADWRVRLLATVQVALAKAERR